MRAARGGRATTGAARHLRPHGEWYLGGVALALVVGLPVVHPRGMAWDAAVGLAATLAVVLALGAWVAHRRERRRRAALVAEVRAMLMDRVNNSLQVVHAALGELAEERHAPSEHIDAALTASRTIARTLDELSLERLAGWHGRYEPRRPRTAPPATTAARLARD